MALTIRIRCEKHKRYNPATTGEYGIVGGCPQCLRLLALMKVVSEIRAQG